MAIVYGLINDESSIHVLTQILLEISNIYITKVFCRKLSGWLYWRIRLYNTLEMYSGMWSRNFSRFQYFNILKYAKCNVTSSFVKNAYWYLAMFPISLWNCVPKNIFLNLLKRSMEKIFLTFCDHLKVLKQSLKRPNFI